MTKLKFKDPKTGKIFEAMVVKIQGDVRLMMPSTEHGKSKESGGFQYLVPLWVTSSPEEWIEVL